MKPSRRMALIAAAVVLSVSACGAADDPASTEATTQTVERPAPAVIEVASATSSTKMAAPEAGAAGQATTGAADSMMMVAPMVFTFDGDLPVLDGEAPSWSFPAGSAATAEQVKAVAAAFGITGEPTMLTEEQGGGWTIGSADYTGPSLTVSSSAMLDWWFNPGPLGPSAVSGCAMPETLPADATVATDGGDAAGASIGIAPCEEPAPPVGVPTAEAAEVEARELLAATGHDLSNYEFESSADRWSAYVTGYLVLDGHRTQSSISVGFGADAAVTWASGSLAVPRPGAAYPRAGAAAGLAALQHQQNQWMGGVSDRAGVENGVSTDAGGPVAEVMPVEGCVTQDTGLDTGLVASDPAPEATVGIEPYCEPFGGPVGPIEPIEVTLTSVDEALTMVWATDGTVWMLPAYTFRSTDGGEYTVVAVDEAYLSTPAG